MKTAVQELQDDLIAMGFIPEGFTLATVAFAKAKKAEAEQSNQFVVMQKSDLDDLVEAIVQRLQSGKEKEKEETWLKSGEVMKMLGCSPGTLQNLRNKGELPFSKIGGILFYEKAAIEKLLRKRIK